MRKALILGAALCLWEDIEAALDLGEFDGVVAAKVAGLYWPGKLDSWVSLHPERFAKDVPERIKFGYPAAGEIVGHENVRISGVKQSPYKFEGQRRSASSGIFAVKRAFELGYERVVLCGIPLDKTAGKIDIGRVWQGAESFRQGFEEAMPHLKDRVRSMSGWTRMKLGAPSSEWLCG